MRRLGFLLHEMTFMRYFCPIAEKARDFGFEPIFFVSDSKKYNSVFLPENKKQLESFCDSHNIMIRDLNEWDNFGCDVVTVEGLNAKTVKADRIISLTYLSDYRLLYPRYIDDVTDVVFPSEKFATEYNTLSEKNHYLGSPKYDFTYSEQNARDRYSLGIHAYVLIIAPKNDSVSYHTMEIMIGILKKKNYKIIVKSRGKDKINDDTLHGDLYLEDVSWYPHATLELISASSFIVNFDSTVIKECIFMQKPVINFKTKIDRGLEFLYRSKLVTELNHNDNHSLIENAIESCELSSQCNTTDSDARSLINEDCKASERILKLLS